MPEISMIAVWIIAIVVLLIVEGMTSGLVTIWFAIGAVAALVAAMLDAPVWLQITVFLAVSFVTLIFTRPLAQKHLNSKTQPTNADRLIGRECIVTETIDNVAGTGAVTVGGQTWTARALSDDPIPLHSRAVVRRIEGVKLIIEPHTEPAEVK
jgi:membrane protein implicated in regulation of membrane protease activity